MWWKPGKTRQLSCVSYCGAEMSHMSHHAGVTSVSSFFSFYHHKLFNEMSAAESDSEGDWEEVHVPEEEKNLEITISTRPTQEKSVLAVIATPRALMTYSLQKIAAIQL